MSKPSRFSHARAALLLAAGLGLAAAAAQASPDITIVVGTCSPGSAEALQTDLRLTNGAVRRAGPNPPAIHAYYCGIPIDDLAATPSWNRLELQYMDQNVNGGRVTARLMRKRLSSGAAGQVAQVASVPSATVTTVGVALPGPLDFSRYTYFVIVYMSMPLGSAEAHTVRLTTR